MPYLYFIIKTTDMTNTHTAQEVRNLLNGIVYFKFRKMNGEVRVAHGTVNMQLIPSEKHPVGTDKNLSDEVVRYYDFTKSAWRSFRKDTFIQIVGHCDIDRATLSA